MQKRHNLRASESDLFLPALNFYSNGKSFCVEWNHDAPDSMQHMPGFFLESGFEVIDIEEAKSSISQFVSHTLERVRELEGDPRVSQLVADWAAIQTVDTDEASFCVIAARMGLDPYSPTQMSDGLVKFIEDTLSKPDSPIVKDLTEVATGDTLMDQWNWVRQTAETYTIGAGEGRQLANSMGEVASPSRVGYRLAREVRNQLALRSDEPIASVEQLGLQLTSKPLIVETQNHVPGRGIRCACGENSEQPDCHCGAASVW